MVKEVAMAGRQKMWCVRLGRDGLIANPLWKNRVNFLIKFHFSHLIFLNIQSGNFLFRFFYSQKILVSFHHNRTQSHFWIVQFIKSFISVHAKNAGLVEEGCNNYKAVNESNMGIWKLKRNYVGGGGGANIINNGIQNAAHIHGVAVVGRTIVSPSRITPATTSRTLANSLGACKWCQKSTTAVPLRVAWVAQANLIWTTPEGFMRNLVNSR